METRERYILMLEDDTDDRQITKTFFADIDCSIGLEFVAHPDELLGYLENCFKTGLSFPSLIILDKYVPAGSGTEVLRTIKRHYLSKHIPAVVVSGSDNPVDIEESYSAGANSYIVKPSTSELTAKKIATFITYWFEVAELPTFQNVHA